MAITRSLRFNDDDTAYLSRTIGAGSNTTATFSAWIKRGNIGTDQQIWSGGVGTSDNDFWFRFDAANTINFSSLASAAYNSIVTTTAVFRDPSAWYHILLRLDSSNGTAADRVQIWVNGVRQAVTITTQIGSGGDFNTGNTGELHTIGRLRYVATAYLDGYMAEIHFIDGTALDPTSFGETDATTGQWVPKTVTGVTYGTNGFYLSFADNSSTTTLGYDDAGSNDWTLNNFSVAAGVGNDSLEDTPTNNWCTLNPVEAGGYATTSNGNLDQLGGSTDYSGKRATFSMTSGKWYWEVRINGTNGVAPGPGIQATAANNYESPVATRRSYYNTGVKFDGSSTAYGASFTTGDIIGVAFDADAGDLTFYKNGASQGVAFSSLSSGPYSPYTADYNGSSTSHNFGQRPFAYTPPTGFVALCTANLPEPAILKPSSYFDVLTHTGTGITKSLTTLGFQPDLVWSKNRTASQDHAIFDAVRSLLYGSRPYLSTNQTNGDRSMLTLYNMDVFTDSPTDNMCTWNTLSPVTTGTISNGMLDTTNTAIATQPCTLFDSYWEITATGSGVSAGTQTETGTGGRTTALTSGKTYGFRMDTSGNLDYRDITSNQPWYSTGPALTGMQFPYVTGGTCSANFGQRDFEGAVS